MLARRGRAISKRLRAGRIAHSAGSTIKRAGSPSASVSPSGPTVRVRAIFRGRVQGVFFRAYCEECAQRLRLSGWVRNRPDGSVEALFEGPAEAVAEAIRWNREDQPHARVDRVETFDETPMGELRGFTVRH